MQRKCKMCPTPIIGRADKIFCSAKCKTSYHEKLTKVSLAATLKINKILLRNREILLEILGKNLAQRKLDRSILDQKKFHFGYITHYHLNSQNKMVHYVYDFSWMIFSDQEVLIKRLR